MRKIILIIPLTFMFSICLIAQVADMENELAIKEVLMKSYVEGLHVKRDTVAIKKGFHENFLMHVYANGEIINASLDMWLDRLQLDGTKNNNIIEAEFKMIDFSGNTAIARMEIYENSKHIYTDYLGLYRFDQGWKIVNKIFYAHK